MPFAVTAIVLLALFGLPLFAVLGAGSLLYAHNSDLDSALLIVELNRLAASPNLIAIPLFTPASVNSGIAIRLGEAASRLSSTISSALSRSLLCA